MLHVISLRLKPLLSKGILIAFSKSTGCKRKKVLKAEGERERVAYQRATADSVPARLPNTVIIVGGEQHSNMLQIWFASGFVSVIPVKPWDKKEEKGRDRPKRGDGLRR